MKQARIAPFLLCFALIFTIGCSSGYYGVVSGSPTSSPVNSETPAMVRAVTPAVASATLTSTVTTATPTVKPTTKAKPSVKPTKAKPTKKPTPVPTATPIPRYIVTVKFSSARLVYNNHVGNEWYIEADVDGTNIRRGGSLKYTLYNADNFKINYSAEEDDSYPDWAFGSFEVNVGQLKTGKNTLTQDIYVVEDRGRYAGNDACWRFTFLVTKTLKK